MRSSAPSSLPLYICAPALMFLPPPSASLPHRQSDRQRECYPLPMASSVEASAASHVDLTGVKDQPAVSLRSMDELERVFRRFDANGDGKISTSELAAVVRSLAGDAVSDDEIGHMIKEMDVDGDGSVDLAEFAAFHRSERNGKGSDRGREWDLLRMATPEGIKGRSPIALKKMEELEQVFRKFDVDRDGKITSAELSSVVRSLAGENVSDDEIRRMVVAMDVDGDGFIDLDELAAFHRREQGEENSEGEWEHDLQVAFRACDVDGNGKLSPEELQQVLKKLGDAYPLGDCTDVINSMDGDGVSFEEFKKMMTDIKNKGSVADKSPKPEHEN